MNKYLAIFGLIIFISGCANPLNKITSDNYADTCSKALDAGRLDVAEEACDRAVINVEWGNLGDELKSERMYNLARVKRRVGKLDEAEKYFIETIKIEEKISPRREIRIGRRLAELSAIYYEQKRYQEASPYLKQLLPLSNLYSGKEKSFLANLYHYYSIELSGTKIAEALQLASVELGFSGGGK
jgi:tetratricopeptide (TPR) repeat protein